MRWFSWAKTNFAICGIAAAVAMATGACGSSDAGFDDEGELERACTPGSTVACSCADGKTGAQTCSETGLSFGKCECAGGAGGADAGIDDAGVDDASTGGDGGAGGSPNDGGKDSGNDSGKDAGNDSGKDDDPCDGISSFGICANSSTVKLCSVPTGQGQPSVVTVKCSALESCQIDAHGFARCVKQPGKCEPGTSECTGSNQARICDEQGSWESYSCAQCRTTPLGAVCSSGETGATTSWSGFVSYEVKGPNDALNAWKSLGYAYALGALVYSYRYDDTVDGYEFIDAAIVDQDGRFTIEIPKDPGPQDIVTVFAVRPNAQGTGIEFAVAEPGVPNGEWKVSEPIPGDTSYFWGWSWRTNSLGAPGAMLQIDADHGSGAMQVFDWLRYIHGSTEYLFGEPGLPLVIWMRNNTSWDCGACFTSTAAKVSSFTFQSQIWIPMTAQDQSFWSDAVTGHELGHWVMSSYGRSPLEGGTHYVSCPTFPGQAWSEGFATGFSALARTSSVYYSKQQGTFFWLDIDTRKYGGGYPWQAPTAAGGLLQLMDENEVAAMLWQLADTTPPAFAQPSNQILFDALASPVVKKDWWQPYGRGYYRHTWDVQPGTCNKKSVVETSLPVPMFADYLDALRCEGMTASEVDAVTKPATRFPYPSASPICN